MIILGSIGKFPSSNKGRKKEKKRVMRVEAQAKSKRISRYTLLFELGSNFFKGSKVDCLRAYSNVSSSRRDL